MVPCREIAFFLNPRILLAIECAALVSLAWTGLPGRERAECTFIHALKSPPTSARLAVLPAAVCSWLSRGSKSTWGNRNSTAGSEAPVVSRKGTDFPHELDGNDHHRAAVH